jgi:hypothetical protein
LIDFVKDRLKSQPIFFVILMRLLVNGTPQYFRPGPQVTQICKPGGQEVQGGMLPLRGNQEIFCAYRQDRFMYTCLFFCV